ncbi:MAG TPA: hypothetical protein VKE41_23745 [Roseiflexaceae bacterium]|nr:hypothetical protein [Roseiflexaceae bacterium]
MAHPLTEPNPAAPLPPVSVAAVLESAMRARKNGNTAAARALLRALAAQQPDLPKVWLLIATVAETRIEQRQALEHVLALDPQNEPARRGLARIGPAEAVAPAASAAALNGQHLDRAAPPSAVHESLAATPTIVSPAVAAAEPSLPSRSSAFVPGEQAADRPAPALRSTETASEQATRDIRWPLYLVLGVSALVVLIAVILIRGSEFAAALGPAPTVGLPAFSAATNAAAPGLGATSVLSTPAESPATLVAGVATLPASAEATAAPTIGLPSPTPAQPTAAPSPLPTPRQILAPGQIVEQGQWHAILIRPEDAIVLDGSIGSFQPRGRFVLALVAVGNDGQAAARLPNDLFALVDGAGNRYAPLRQISTAYLNTYGRGQHGDLSMEDLIPADGGNRSVPLIFDVPPGTRPLYLLAGDSPAGWAIIP